MSPDKARQGVQLIVNADDFGSSEDVNAAIIRCTRRGIVTSTSVMANMPCVHEEVKELQSICPYLSIGLHLNLTTGRPVCAPEEVSSLVDSGGNFLNAATLERRLWFGRVDRQHLQKEIEAQLATLQERVTVISHVDSHKHIHRYPLVLSVLLSTAQRWHITKVRTNHRCYISSKVDAASSWRTSLRHHLRSPASVPGLGLKLMQKWLIRKHQFTAPDALVTAVPSIPIGADVDVALSGWVRTLARLPNGIFEVNFHPGGVVGEEELLCHPSLRDQLGQVRPISYYDLKN